MTHTTFIHDCPECTSQCEHVLDPIIMVDENFGFNCEICGCDFVATIRTDVNVYGHGDYKGGK